MGSGVGVSLAGWGFLLSDKMCQSNSKNCTSEMAESLEDINFNDSETLCVQKH